MPAQERPKGLADNGNHKRNDYFLFDKKNREKHKKKMKQKSTDKIVCKGKSLYEYMILNLLTMFKQIKQQKKVKKNDEKIDKCRQYTMKSKAKKYSKLIVMI